MLTLVEAKHTQTASSAIKALAQAADEVACASALLAPAALLEFSTSKARPHWRESLLIQ